MKFNIAYPRNGTQKMFNVDDEHKWGQLIDRRMGQEFDGETLGEEFKGYIFKITGGMDNDGFAMKQGILIKGRVRLILEAESTGFVCHRVGAHRRKAVRGCIVGPDMACLSLVVLKKGEEEIAGLTDVNHPRRLGPKRANKIRRLFVLPRHSTNIGKKEDNLKKVEVDKFDVCRYVVKRPSKEIGDKKYYKAPKIQRLVTAERQRRKRVFKETKKQRVQKSEENFNTYVKTLQGMKEIRRERSASNTGKPKVSEKKVAN